MITRQRLIVSHLAALKLSKIGISGDAKNLTELTKIGCYLIVILYTIRYRS